MDKLTKQQEDIICELLHCSYSEEISQFILETIERHNWTRSILASDPSFLNEEQRELYFQLGGGYKMNEVKEDIKIAICNQKIADILEENGITKYLYENEDYLNAIREGEIICEGINVEEIKKNLEISKNML